MTRSLSQKFRFFTFLCIALLAYVHGYNLNDTYLTPFSTIDEPLTITTFFEYLFSNGLLRFRIPLLFLISGYLYALYDHRSYLQQIKTRFKTLIIPLLLWSAFGLLLTFLWQQVPYTADIVAKAGIDQLNDNRPYTEIGWIGILHRWLLAPISYQLWFLMALFVFNLLYPFIKWMVTHLPYIWLPITFLYFFILIFQLPLIDGRGLFFFSLGVWIQKKNYSIEDEPSWFSLGLTLILFIGLSFVKTFMAFEFEHLDIRKVSELGLNIVALAVLHQLSIIAGILAMWFGANKIMHWFLKQKWFNHASGFSFFIFGLHVPLLPYVMTWALDTLQHLPNYRLLCFIFIPFLFLVFSVWLGGLTRKYMPGVYKMLTGGRGF